MRHRYSILGKHITIWCPLTLGMHGLPLFNPSIISDLTRSVSFYQKYCVPRFSWDLLRAWPSTWIMLEITFIMRWKRNFRVLTLKLYIHDHLLTEDGLQFGVSKMAWWPNNLRGSYGHRNHKIYFSEISYFKPLSIYSFKCKLLSSNRK